MVNLPSFPGTIFGDPSDEAILQPFIDSGNTAWVLAAAALVLFMTPGLAFFYGGMVRTKSVLNMMMMSFITMGTVGTAWILWRVPQPDGAVFVKEFHPHGRLDALLSKLGRNPARREWDLLCRLKNWAVEHRPDRPSCAEEASAPQASGDRCVPP